MHTTLKYKNSYDHKKSYCKDLNCILKSFTYFFVAKIYLFSFLLKLMYKNNCFLKYNKIRRSTWLSLFQNKLSWAN